MNTRQRLALIDAGEPIPDTRPPVDPVIRRIAQDRVASQLIANPLKPGEDATRRELLDLEIERLTPREAETLPDEDIPL